MPALVQGLVPEQVPEQVPGLVPEQVPGLEQAPEQVLVPEQVPGLEQEQAPEQEQGLVPELAPEPGLEFGYRNRLMPGANPVRAAAFGAEWIGCRRLVWEV
ncbi:MAG TPA: hypothetical protein V6C52_10300 [Coleofasciculaceae cyanobacterium]